MATARKLRDRGDGTIYQASDGYWHDRLVVGVKPDGSPDRRHTRSRDRGSVAKLREWGKERDSGRVTGAGKVPTVAAVMSDYLTVTCPQLVAGARMSPRTFHDYVSKDRNWITPQLGAHRANRLTASHIEGWHNRLSRPACPPPAC